MGSPMLRDQSTLNPLSLLALIGKKGSRSAVFGSLLVATLALAACSPEAQSNAVVEKPVEKDVPQAEPASGTPAQRAVADEMRGLVLARGIVQRVTEKCADFQIDDSKMNAERERLTGLAQKQFSSQQEFLNAAGADKQEQMGEEMRRFFRDRGVTWDSPSKDYCKLGATLHADKDSAGKYLIKR